jgi:hypothetical protein
MSRVWWIGSAFDPVTAPTASSDPPKMALFGAALFALLMFLADPAAAATQEGNTAMINWKAMDICARQAQAAFPDFTADSNAKRDAKLKECLSGSNLPPRQLEMPAQPR